MNRYFHRAGWQFLTTTSYAQKCLLFKLTNELRFRVAIRAQTKRCNRPWKIRTVLSNKSFLSPFQQPFEPSSSHSPRLSNNDQYETPDFFANTTRPSFRKKKTIATFLVKSCETQVTVLLSQNENVQEQRTVWDGALRRCRLFFVVNSTDRFIVLRKL